jgi:hypothetical protein
MNLTKVAAMPGSGGGALAWQPPEVWARPAPTKEPLPPGWPFHELVVETDTMESLIKVAREAISLVGRQSVVTVLHRFGASKLSELPQREWHAFRRSCEYLINEYDERRV